MLKLRKKNRKSLGLGSELSLKRKIRELKTPLQVYIHILQFDLLRDLRKNLSYLRKFTVKSFPARKKGEYFIELKAFLNTEQVRFRAVLSSTFLENKIYTQSISGNMLIW